MPLIDGLTLVVGDELLVKNEAAGANNGRYTVTNAGSGGAAWVLTRSTDADTTPEVWPGMGVLYIGEGNANGGRLVALTTPGPITLNTTSLSFVVVEPGESKFNVKRFGARGDGSDDSAAINAALLVAAIAGGTVFLPAGTYAAEGISIDGTGVILEMAAGATIKHIAASETYCLRIASTAVDCAIVGGKVDGNNNLIEATVYTVLIGGLRSKVDGLHVYDAVLDGIAGLADSRDVQIQNCHVYKVNSETAAAGRVGISASAAGTTYHWTISNCHVRDTNHWGIGVLSTAEDCLIIGCQVYDTGGDAYTGYAAGNVRLTVRDSIGLNNGNHGTHVGGTDPTVEGCVFVNSGNDGILVQSAPNSEPTYSTGATVVGNRIIDAGNNGIEVTSYSDVTLGDNHLRLGNANIAHGFLLEDIDGLTVQGCAVNGSANRGVQMSGVTNVVFGGNLVRNSGTHGLKFGSYTRPDTTVIDVSNVLIEGNAIVDSGGGWGIRTDINVANVEVVNNNLEGNSSGSVSLIGSGNRIGANRGWTQAVQEFTASDTWEKPPGSVTVEVDLQGPSGGGGGGASVVSGTACSGGGGSGGGARHTRRFNAADLSDAVAVTIGKGGAGGLGGSGAKGGDGSAASGPSMFGSYMSAHAGGAGSGGQIGSGSGGGGGAGFNGAGGAASAGTGGSAGSVGGAAGGSAANGGSNANWGAGAGGGGGINGAAGGAGNLAAHGPPGGAAGGGISVASVAFGGTNAAIAMGSGADAATGGANTGGAGGNGAAGAQVAGNAGAGGGGNLAGSGGAGGRGSRGAGSGGGGSAIGGTGGKGGQGADGFCRVTSYNL